MDILYYSNYCKHCKNVLQTLVKSNLSNKISYVCIDKRKIDPATNQTKIILENGNTVMLPPNIKSVPSLLLVNQQFKLIVGDDIVKHYHKDIKKNINKATNNNGEPLGYHIINYGNSNITSEFFTSYDLTPDELSAKGNSERRNMHNYVSVDNDLQLIETPPDTYTADKISSDVTLDTLQQKRMDEVSMGNNMPTPPPQLNI
tara:strand:- start:3357 stop:3962 length:606 start_codon:yes stop_codon:yes gene_type:complete